MSANTMRWTARDLTALTWIHDQRAVSYRQLAHLLGILGNGEPVGDRAVRRALERWEREGLIVRRSHTEVPSRVVWLTPKGQREIGVEEVRYGGPSMKTIPHEIAVGWVRLWAERAELRWEQDTYSSKGNRADGVIIDNHNGDTIKSAVEVELTQKEIVRVKQRIAARLKDFDYLVWVVPDDKPHIEKMLERERGALAHEDAARIQIHRLSEVVK